MKDDSQFSDSTPPLSEGGWARWLHWSVEEGGNDAAPVSGHKFKKLRDCISFLLEHSLWENQQPHSSECPLMPC